MKTLIAMLAVMMGTAAFAQVRVEVAVPAPPIPTVRFEAAPAMVEVEPGIQVVPDHEEEVFMVDHVYWTRHGGRWYRCGDHRGGWVEVERGRVPGRLVAYPEGRYRHWRRAEERREVRHEVRQEVRREERHEERREEKHHH
jgi:hypothetical protein